jgi:hypothetical protein
VKQTQLLTQATRKDLTPAASVLELERRHEEYLEKRKKKYDEKREQEELEKRKKEEEERRRRDKLIHSQLPEGSTRLTKAVEERVKAVSRYNQPTSSVVASPSSNCLSVSVSGCCR